MTIRQCVVSYKDVRGICHSIEVEAESLYEAVVLAIDRFREDPWIEPIGQATVLDVEARQPATTHSVSLQQVERWLGGATSSPMEASKKAKLKMLLLK